MPGRLQHGPTTPACYLARSAVFWRAGLAPVPPLARLTGELQLFDCPGCGAPATVESRWQAGGTSYVKLRCLHRHWHLVPADQRTGSPVGAAAR
ncbi:hypothetical protein [Modestobacter sp. NPDC049651]|uniref:hypothetical protein n=1 Tax=unclassified Modestobacter TaxID=2643866 RepID=UPI00340E00E4